jgi:hypothetical protein
MNENDQIIVSQNVSDSNLFDNWYGENISRLTQSARDMGLEARVKEIMRLAWKGCCSAKNKELSGLHDQVKLLKDDIDSKQKKYDELHLELQKVTNKLIQAEKNAKK